MPDDPIIAALRRDAELLRAEAPAMNAAKAWHRMRTMRAQRLRRMLDLCGWSLRLGLALVLAGALAGAPRAAPGLLPALALVGWLTTGLCAPLGRAHWPNLANRATLRE